MSEENLEIVRRGYEALNDGDLDRMAEYVASDFEYIASGAIPGAKGTYRGFEDFKRFTEWMWSEFENPRWEVHEMIDAEDQVLVSLTNRGRGKQSGAEVSWDVWQLWTFRDGKVVRGQGLNDRDEALEAAGLSE